MLFFSLAFSLVGLWISFQDFRTHRIPNLALLGLILMLPWYWSIAPIHLRYFLISGILGLFLLGTLFLFTRLRCSVGIGDAKLFSISCFFSTPYTLPLFMISSGVLGIGLAFFYRKILHEKKFPLGPALVGGLIRTIFSIF